MEPLDPTARIALLEKVAENSLKNQERLEDRIDKLDAYHQKIVDRLDEHLMRDNETQAEMNKTLGHLSASFEALADSIKDAANGAALAIKHETQMQTLVKIGGWLSVLCGAGWAVFKFFHGA